MLKILVCVKDNVAEVFHDPHPEVNTASAIRSFTLSIKEQTFKDDYSLYQVGTFNTDNGAIVSNEPVRIMSGHDVKMEQVSSISQEQQLDDLAKHEALKKQSGI